MKLVSMFLLRTKVYWRFISHIRISEQKHETCLNVFTANESILEVYLTYNYYNLPLKLIPHFFPYYISLFHYMLFVVILFNIFAYLNHLAYLCTTLICILQSLINS